jgi:hypothetical protein
MSEARERVGRFPSANGEGALELRTHQDKRMSEARERVGRFPSANGEGALELRTHQEA